MNLPNEEELRILIKVHADVIGGTAMSASYTDLKRAIDRLAGWVHALGPVGKAEAERK